MFLFYYSSFFMDFLFIKNKSEIKQKIKIKNEKLKNEKMKKN